MDIERGSDKHGALRDDALAAEDQSGVDLAPDGTLTGGTPTGLRPEEVAARSEIAQYLGKEVWPADAAALLSLASGRQAPDAVVRQLSALPSGREYANLEEVWQALGGGREQRD